MKKPSMEAKPRKPSDRAIIREQDRRISELERQVEYLKDSQYRHDEWLRQAKRDAGYRDSISFDVVWAKALAALLAAPDREQGSHPFTHSTACWCRGGASTEGQGGGR